MIVVDPVDVATAHQISSVIKPFVVSTYRCARCHVPVSEQLTPVTVMVCEWICDWKMTRSPTFCGLTVSVVPPWTSAETGKVAASAIAEIACAAFSSPTVSTDVINAMVMMHFDATRAVFPRVQ